MKKFNVTGMSCAACSARVEKAVKVVEGVDSVSVNLLTNSMIVQGSATDDQIISAVVQAGYGASVAGQKDQSKTKTDQNEALKDKETPVLVKRLVFSGGSSYYCHSGAIFYCTNDGAMRKREGIT